MTLRVHYLQHVPFEGPGSIAAWAEGHGHEQTVTRLHAGDALPDPAAVDLLVVLGGPMGVHDVDRHPWLAAEQQWLRQALAGSLRMIGICLGAQLIAAALGAPVRSGGGREIGWFDVERSDAAAATAAGAVLPQRFGAFHWHGDTFETPAGAVGLGASAACANQGFVLDDRVLATQFHLETTPASARALLEHCADELDGSRWVQTPEQILSDPVRFRRLNAHMDAVLDAFAARP